MGVSSTKTTAERVRKHNESRKARKITLDGDALDALAAYQYANGLGSRSEALRSLLTPAGESAADDQMALELRALVEAAVEAGLRHQNFNELMGPDTLRLMTDEIMDGLTPHLKAKATCVTT